MKVCIKEIRKPVQKRSIDKKNALLEAGLRLISQKGLHHINSKDIAKEAGVSIGSFYAYFKDKNTLFYELVQNYKDKTTFQENECLDSESPKEYIRTFLNTKLELAKQYPSAFHREIHYQRTRDQAIGQLYNDYKNAELKVFMALLNGISDYTNIKDTRTASNLAFNVYEEMITSVLEISDEIEQQELLESYIELLTRYLFNQ